MFSLSVQISFSQAGELKGRVVTDSLSGILVNIYNISKLKGVINNSEGYFKITSSVSDTIIFNAIQYKNYQLIVTKEDLENPNLIIKLQPKTELLQEVLVTSSGLSGNLESDLQNIKTDQFIDGKQFVPKKGTMEYALMNSAPASAGVDVVMLFNLINGKIKKDKRDQKLKDLKSLIENIKADFPKEFYTVDLQIKELYIQDFMNYCFEDSYFKNLAQKNEKLKLVALFQQKANEYRKLKREND